MSSQAGARLPLLPLKQVITDRFQDRDKTSLFKSEKRVLFAVPGAFPPPRAGSAAVTVFELSLMRPDITLEGIREAAQALKKVVLRTPTLPCLWLGNQIDAAVFLKLENLQFTASFKTRGTYVKLRQLSPDQRRKGVVTVSAGNHAQGLAYHARAFGIPATIIMPKNTPLAKIENTKNLGATIILEGKDFKEAGAFAARLATDQGLIFISPYDDPAIITGQGTVALEMLADVPDLEVLVIPIGGGGLAAGMAVAAKALNPAIDIIGVQSASCPAMTQALYPERAFSRERLSSAPLAEGIAVQSPGLLTQAILKDHLSDILLVTEEQIEVAIEDLMIYGKLTVEGAGAAGVAALKANPHRFSGRKVGVVIGGGNIDARVLSSLLLRSLVRHGKLVRLKIDISDAPGVLGEISHIIGKAGGNIFEISHQRLFNHITVKMAEVDVVVETRDAPHAQEIIATLEASGFPTQAMG